MVAKSSQESAIFQDVPEDPDIAILVTRLKAIFSDVGLYRKLLRSRDSDAQKLLDTFQWLLDTPKLDAEFRHGLIIATQRIARNSNLYPTCYELKDVVQDGQDPVSSGGFADIYKGVFQGRVVCMKVIRLYQVSKVEDFLRAVSKETILWGQLLHPNVLPIYGLYRIRSKICLVSPWMKEGNLSEYLEHKPDANRLQLAVDVAHGLSYLHKNAIVHGDLKSPNILINDQGRACLADFGLSSISDSKVLKWTSHSSAASRGGSVRWQAPELFDVENDEPVNNSMASDVYAWSFVCYEIFTGDIPFPNLLRDATVMNKVQSGARPARPTTSSPAWRDWGLTKKIWSIMEECWKQDPHERPDIKRVLEKMMPDLAHDERSSASGSTLTPSEFRRASNSCDVVTVSTLDSLLRSAEGLTALSPNCSHALEPTASYSDTNQTTHKELTTLVGINQGCNPTQNLEHDLVDRPPKRKRSHDSADSVDLRRPVVPWTNEASSDPNTKHSVTLPSPPIPEPSSSLHSDLHPVQSAAEPHMLSNVNAQTTLQHPSQYSTETTDQLLQYYTQNVVSVQYPFADNSVRATICEAVLPHGRLREATGLLVSVHQQRSKKPGLMAFHSEEMQTRIRDLQSMIREFGSNSEDAMAALHVISSYLFDGRSGPWEQWLDIPYRYVDYLFVKYGGPSEVLVRCSAKDAVIIKMTIWFDVLASVTTQRSPHFLLAIRTMFNLRQTHVFNTYSDGKSSMMSLLGCHDEVIWALAEISHLSEWKQVQMAENCLSVPSLVRRAMPIDDVLAPPPQSRIYASGDIHGCRVLAAEIFRSSARLYLETVLSGDYPLVPEIKECVQDTINCIERLSSPPSDVQVNSQRMSQSIVQNTMFAFFICGALAEKEVHRDVIKSLLDLEGDRVGNFGSTQDLFDKLWELREGTWRAPDSTASLCRPDAVNWRKMLSEANILLA